MTLNFALSRPQIAVVLVAGTLALGGCAQTLDHDAPRHIMVTTNILGDVVENLVGEAAEVTTLMAPGSDPHSFEISAQQAAMFGEADLVVANGLGLEEGLQQHLDRAADAGAKIFEAGAHIQALAYAEGSGATVPDPHFWTDPNRMIDVIDALETELVALLGDDAPAVHRTVETYREQLVELDQHMDESFSAVPAEHRALVTNHHVFGYLARRYDFTIIGAVIPGGTTLASPSAADLKSLTTAIEQAGVQAIFADSSQPDQLMQALANETGRSVQVIELFSESLSAPQGAADTYMSMMRTNTERITGGLMP